jgi:hypothetical protein
MVQPISQALPQRPFIRLLRPLPLLLFLSHGLGAKRRFKFETFWLKLPGFMEVVQQSWATVIVNVDPCKRLDIKLRKLARDLQNWSSRQIGSVRLQLALARETILGLDVAEEDRVLTLEERTLRARLKLRTLGLASLARTIARQRSRISFLAEGDASTRFFHLQACHRARKNRIEALRCTG